MHHGFSDSLLDRSRGFLLLALLCARSQIVNSTLDSSRFLWQQAHQVLLLLVSKVLMYSAWRTRRLIGRSLSINGAYPKVNDLFEACRRWNCGG